MYKTLKRWNLKYSLVITLMLVNNVVNAAVTFKPKLSGFFLGEYIYSNYNQSLPSGNRFGQLKTFDILCFPRAMFNMQSNTDDNAAFNLFMGFNFRHSCCYGNKNDPWSFTKFGVTDHAYIKIKNSQILPSEVLFGIQYLPYGDYQNNAIPASFTQLLTQVQSGALVVNTSIDDFTISGFVLNGKKSPTSARWINNFGVQVKYNKENYKFKFGYLYNIANSVNYIVNSLPSSQTANPLAATFQKHVSGIAANLNVSLIDDYFIELAMTWALNKFNPRDLNWKLAGAQPGALLAKLTKKMILLGYKNKISINYQYSWQALNVRGPNLLRGLPKQRYQFDWVVEPVKDVECGIHHIIDLAYQSALKNSQTFIFTISYLFDLS
jgi:hypothetical protein